MMATYLKHVGGYGFMYNTILLCVYIGVRKLLTFRQMLEKKLE
jgi:hypothetical protein